MPSAKKTKRKVSEPKKPFRKKVATPRAPYGQTTMLREEIAGLRKIVDRLESELRQARPISELRARNVLWLEPGLDPDWERRLMTLPPGEQPRYFILRWRVLRALVEKMLYPDGSIPLEYGDPHGGTQ